MVFSLQYEQGHCIRSDIRWPIQVVSLIEKQKLHFLLVIVVSFFSERLTVKVFHIIYSNQCWRLKTISATW